MKKNKKTVNSIILIMLLMIMSGCGAAVETTPGVTGSSTSEISTSTSTLTSSDTTPPTVSSTSPENGKTDVAINSSITATLSEAMASSTFTTSSFTLDNGVTGSVTYSGTTATFTPLVDLSYSTTYTATITTGVTDASGNAMASNYTWTFTTGTAPDTTPPTVLSTNPSNGAPNVALNAAITATFDETMTASTFTTSSFTLNNAVTGVVTYADKTVTFTPSEILTANTAYTAKITTEVKDAAGNALATEYTWTFTAGNNSVKLTWSAPTANADGSSLTDLTGYKIYYGTSSGVYSSSVDVGNTTTYDFLNLSTGIYYFSVKAYDANKNESDYSEEVSKNIL